VVVERILATSGSEGFDAQSGSYRDLFAAGIMDPTKVVRSALQHAASIGSMVLTTDAVVVEAPEDDDSGEEGAS
jgi:chaperonin GroEL